MWRAGVEGSGHAADMSPQVWWTMFFTDLRLNSHVQRSPPGGRSTQLPPATF